jgi:hypothetical protein
MLEAWFFWMVFCDVLDRGQLWRNISQKYRLQEAF